MILSDSQNTCITYKTRIIYLAHVTYITHITYITYIHKSYTKVNF